MTDRDFLDGKPRSGDYVVRAPPVGDAIGQTLKGAYPVHSLSADMMMLLGKIDRPLH